MRFNKVIPKQKWTREKTEAQINSVFADIAEFNRSMNKIDSEINFLNHTKEALKRRVGYKWKYLRQLQEQLKEM